MFKTDTALIEERSLKYNFAKEYNREQAMSADPEELRRLIEVKELVRYRIKRNPLLGFVPNGQAEKVVQSEAEITDYVGGNGTGKTATMANIVGNLVFGVQNSWFEHPRFRKMKRPNRGRIVGTPANCAGAISEEIKKWFPDGRYNTLRHHRDYDYLYELDNGCIFDVYTYEMDVKQFEGVTLDWVVMDEPPPQRIWNACVSRLRQGGYIYRFFTPLANAGWILDQYEENKLDLAI